MNMKKVIAILTLCICLIMTIISPCYAEEKNRSEQSVEFEDYKVGSFSLAVPSNWE